MTRITSLFFIIGMTLSLGSIATFIVMNVAVGSSLNTTMIHHQRLFATASSRALTVPGVCILFAATVQSVCFSGHQRFADGWELARLALATLTLVNTIAFVRPLVAEVSKIAEQGAARGQMPESYLKRKKLEDRFGTANFLMIVAILLLTAFRP